MEEYLSSWNSEPKYYDESIKKKLPQEGKKNILITAALPYVNNVPHLGNIIGCVLSGDVFSRYCKIRGYQSIYISGTDEYGTATEMKALKDGKTPQEICEKFYHLHKQIYEWFNIEFDNFGRTSTANQTEIAQDIFKKLHANGYTSIASLEQLHCGKCDKFLADRFVFGTCPNCNYDDARGDQCDKCGKLIDAVELIDPKCHICSETPVVKSSNHVFLDLKKLSPKVEEFINTVTSAENSHWSSNATAISKSWIKSGLEQRCITRDLKWGTPVPLEGFEDKVFYVWYDAPIGYLSITKTLLGDNWTKWWKNPDNVELYQFIGKDNVAFHGVMFPASQLGTGDNYTMVKHLCATEYLNYENQKFSKSRGTGVFGDAVADIDIPADIWRFYLIYMRPENQDTAFSWDDFMAKINSELNNNIGNFINRSMTFLYNSFDGVVQEMELLDVDRELLKALDEDIKEFTALLEDVKLRDGLSKILEISRKGNQYFQANQPWVLVKGNEEEKRRAGTIISIGTNIALLIGTLLYLYMPEVSRQIRDFCNIEHIIQLPEHPIQFLKAGHHINKPVPLFVKLEANKVAEWKRRFGSASDQPVTEKAAAEKKRSGKTDKKEKKSSEQATPPAMSATENNKNMENGISKKDKKEKKAAARNEKLAKVEQSTKPAEDPAMKAQLDEIRQKFNIKQVKTVHSETANEANATADKLEKELAEMQKYFYDILLPTYQKNRLSEIEDENAALTTDVEKLKKQLFEIRKKVGYDVMEDPRVITNPVKETKLVNTTKKPATKDSKAEEISKAEPPNKEAKPKKEKAPKEKGGNKEAAVDDEIDVGRLDLRVGRILEAKKHPDADALYVETIDLGEEKPRTVVSGLVKHVPLEEMQNRLVVCLCNLKPAKMRGIESCAMVMCASSAEKVEIMEVDPTAKPGDVVICEPFNHRPDAQLNPKKKIWETVAPDLMVSEDGRATYKGSPLLVVGKTPMTAPSLRNVNVK
jgi:methionyl-tRNA synthetase